VITFDVHDEECPSVLAIGGDPVAVESIRDLIPAEYGILDARKHASDAVISDQLCDPTRVIETADAVLAAESITITVDRPDAPRVPAYVLLHAPGDFDVRWTRAGDASAELVAHLHLAVEWVPTWALRRTDVDLVTSDYRGQTSRALDRLASATSDLKG
jgi:hypothetical protein